MRFFCMQLLTGARISLDMSTTTLPITAASFEKVKLGDSLGRAIVSLPIKYREVLFLRDVKNLDKAETAWILNITAGAVRARLLRARMQVYGTLKSSLLMRVRYKSLVNRYRLFRGTESE